MKTEYPDAAKTETIAAIASAAGGGIGVIRISGPQAATIAQKIMGRELVLAPRTAVFARFYAVDQTLLDEGLLLYFPAPHSFTGEDVIELQGHGGCVVLDQVLQRVLQLGARQARAGEFSERAFLNHKIDLTQAEAIADLINAETHDAAKAAIASLSGAFSNRIHELVEQITQLRVYLEAAIDFSDEEIDFLSDQATNQRFVQVQQSLAQIAQAAVQGQLLRDGITLVLVGAPNVGKSSILNQLAGTDAAIVTDIPGTTRDVLREQIQLQGIPLHILDTAGLRTTPADAVEAEGIARTRKALKTADLALVIMDEHQPQSVDADLPPQLQTITIWNKADLTGLPIGRQDTATVRISARSGAGMDDLRDLIQERVGVKQHHEGLFSARRRHLEALQEAQECFVQVQALWRQGQHLELIAEELRQMQQILGRITGEVTVDDLLGEIFSSFCIGK